jgi:hypothetical protein
MCISALACTGSILLYISALAQGVFLLCPWALWSSHMHVEWYAFICGFGVHSPCAFQLVLIHVRVFKSSLQLVRRYRIS